MRNWWVPLITFNNIIFLMLAIMNITVIEFNLTYVHFSYIVSFFSLLVGLERGEGGGGVKQKSKN